MKEQADDFKETTDLEGLALPFNVLYESHLIILLRWIGALTVNECSYEDEMVRWDNYGATNWTEAESHYYHSKKFVTSDTPRPPMMNWLLTSLAQVVSLHCSYMD